jgi:hypothetical protein
MMASSDKDGLLSIRTWHNFKPRNSPSVGVWIWNISQKVHVLTACFTVGGSTTEKWLDPEFSDLINRLIPWYNPYMISLLTGGLDWRKLTTNDMPWKNIPCLQPLPVCVSLLLDHHKESSSALSLPSAVMLCLTMHLETMKPAGHGLKPLKLWAKINLSSFKLFFLKLEEINQLGL